MSQPSGEKKKPKAEKIKLVARNPRKLKAALRNWVEASETVGFDPLGLDEAPLWVDKALAEVVKVIMPGNRLPATGEWDLELIGEFFGRLQVLGKLYNGEIPMGPVVQGEYDRLMKFMASQPQSPERTAREKMAVKDLKVRIKAVQKSIPDLTSAALASSHEDMIKFNKGLQRGLNLAPDELVTANTFERHTRTLYVLGVGWRFWVTCKSLHHVYDLLCQMVGQDKIGSFKSFERLCAKIGFSIRGRGRPSMKK